MTAAHPHDPFRPFEGAEPTPAPEARKEPDPDPVPAPKPETGRKQPRRRGRRRGASSDQVGEVAEVDEAEAELQQALAELDGKDAPGDDSAG